MADHSNYKNRSRHHAKTGASGSVCLQNRWLQTGDSQLVLKAAKRR